MVLTINIRVDIGTSSCCLRNTIQYGQQSLGQAQQITEAVETKVYQVSGQFDHLQKQQY